MKRLIFLVGESGAGKDTAADYLCEAYGFRKIPSYTTRAMREGEQQGREHIFLTLDSVDNPEAWCLRNGEHCLAKTFFGGHWYWATAEQMYSAGQDTVYIIDEAGLYNVLTNPDTKQKISELFDYETWRIERVNNSVDQERRDRDQGRMQLHTSWYDYIIYNNYDIDYLYSAIDAILTHTRQ